MKIVYFGTPQLAAGILKKLIDSEHEVIAVVTQPDRASGRGKNVKFSAAKEAACEAGIPVLQPEKVNTPEFLDELEALNADIHVVAAYAQKLPDRLLGMAPFGCINVHPSLLPKYRGAAPMMAAILNGDKIGGVTIMKMAEKMDAGDILLQQEMPLAANETNASLEAKATELGGELLLKAIEGIAAGTIVPTPQNDSESTYVRQLSKEAGLIDFTEEAAVIERKIRAYDPWPGTFTYLDGKTFKIYEAAVIEENTESDAGCVVCSDKKKIRIQTGKGLLEPVSIQIEGKKRMTMEEFLRGKKIEQGTRLGRE